MTDFDPQAFGARLRDEMGVRGLDVKALREAVHLETGGARGTSYGSVWSYVNGQAPLEPRREVVEGMAKVLRVRAAWLLHGVEPRTEGEAVARGEARTVGDDTPPEWLPFMRGIAEARGRLAELYGGNSFLGRDDLLIGLAMRFLRSGGRPLESYSEEQVAEAVFLLGWLIFLPGNALGGSDYLNNQGEYESYFLAMVAALRIAMPGHDRAYPLSSLDELRAARAAWEARFPIPASPEAAEEFDRARAPFRQQED